MSAASAAAASDAPTVPGKGKKRLLIALIVGGVLLLLALAGGAAVLMMNQRAAAAAAGADDTEVADEAPKKAVRKGPPTFAPLDPFTVNLADRDAERFAQIGITLELEAAKDAETVKQFMPAIRHNVLMVLAHKTAAELLERDGKLKLADEVRREALRALEADDADDPPVRSVQFSTFIVQ